MPKDSQKIILLIGELSVISGYVDALFLPKPKVESKAERECAVEAKHLRETDGTASGICVCAKMSES